MRTVCVTRFSAWRESSRRLIAEDVKPESVRFTDGLQETLFEAGDNASAASPAPKSSFAVPQAFLALAETVAMHRDPDRWNLLYRTLYRTVRLGERHLLQVEVDPDIRQLAMMRAAVDRDIHKMHAFVRFRKTSGENEQYVAWYRPDHLILPRVAPWFARRFGSMHWAILTPDASASWDTRTLRFGAGVPRPDPRDSDALEELWRSYYASIFNPARVNAEAMTKELPVRHWATLPEAELIPKLLIEASGREGRMRDVQPPSAAPFLPLGQGLPVLAQAVRTCQGCELYRHATQPVFGEGPGQAPIMLIGEQPGDQEDLDGKPFIGPAGQLLNTALAEAAIDRSTVYVTNAVKHFKFEERGTGRIHKKPRGVEVAACRPWLTAEIEQVNPRVLVALGATAALSIGGREFAIQKERGKLIPVAGSRQMLITVHPSYLLRLPETDRAAEFTRFVADLRLVRQIAALS